MALLTESSSHHGFGHPTGAAYESHYAFANQASDDGGSSDTGTSSFVTSMDYSSADWVPLGASDFFPPGLSFSNAEVDTEGMDHHDTLSTSPTSNMYSEQGNTGRGTYGTLGGFFESYDQPSHDRLYREALSPNAGLTQANSGLASLLISTLARCLNGIQKGSNSMQAINRHGQLLHPAINVRQTRIITSPVLLIGVLLLMTEHLLVLLIHLLA